MIKDKIIKVGYITTIKLEDIFENDEEFELFNNSHASSQRAFLMEKCDFIHEDVLNNIDDSIIEEIRDIYNNEK